MSDFDINEVLSKLTPEKVEAAFKAARHERCDFNETPIMSFDMPMEVFITGVLFDALTVKLDPRTDGLLGSWRRDCASRPVGDGDVMRAWNPDALKFFYERIREHGGDAVNLIDVGAHTGSFALLAAHDERLHVQTFEPNRRVASVLQRNVYLNHLGGRVTIDRMALGNERGWSPLSIPDAETGCATLGKPLRADPNRIALVPVARLDDVCDLYPVDFLKVDVEGAEWLVLQGADKTIWEGKPQMLIERDPRNTEQFGYEPYKITDLLESWGAKWKPIGHEDIYVYWK